MTQQRGAERWRGRALGLFVVSVCVVVVSVVSMVWLIALGDDEDRHGRPPGLTTGEAPIRETPEVSTELAGGTKLPVRLDIPIIDVSTSVVRLDLHNDGSVEVPADPDRAGWFERGPRPGAKGSAVILGHVDSLTGPAVFARLKELKRGDVVDVRRSDGSVVTFAVRRLVLYPNSQFPAQRIYGAKGARRLNLVTCGGSYDSDQGGYQSNLVVYTRRIHRP